MPRWNFEIMKGTLTRAQKDKMASQITKIYTDLGLPGFAVNVFFHENEEGGFYSGAKTPAPAAFFAITHAARPFKDEEERLQFHASVDEIVRPVFEPKGIKWEYNVYIHPGDNWRISGIVPPIIAGRMDVWEKWVQEDRPVVY
jgi:phenylpyruvate tautomerase PptA (4-oxalocrotonate tautomerase family)